MGFNSLQVGYKPQMNRKDASRDDCFNSLQVGYKLSIRHLKRRQHYVSIPYRLATNPYDPKLYLSWGRQFQFLIGWLQTKIGTAIQSALSGKGTSSRFNSLQVGYKRGNYGLEGGG